jgi:chromosome segregation protein
MIISFDRVILYGFGRYRNKVEVTLTNGINVCTAANEQGKSTLVDGLAAIIFGLPQSADSRSFGTRRFRNWYNPTRFEGELEFTSDSMRYRIWRNFDNHRISLQRFNNGAWQELVRGEHNPMARRANVNYEEKIRQLFGMTSRELFTATFQIAQPLPDEERIAPGIQQLLSGAGTHYKDALESLLNELKSITRYTGRLGVTSRDMNQDRMLEKLSQEAAAVKEQIAAGKENVDMLEVLSAKLHESRQAARQTEVQLAEKKRLFAAWQSWRSIRERYLESVAKQGQLESVVQRAETLRLQMVKMETQLNQEFTIFKDHSVETGEELYALADIEKSYQSLVKEQSELAEKEQSAYAEVDELEKRLHGELADVRGKSWLPDIARRLCEQIAAAEALSDQTEEIKSQIDEIEEKMAAMPDFKRLGKAPLQALGSLRREINTVSALWRQFKHDSDRLNELQLVREHQYAVFEHASPELRDAMANYKTTKEQLENKLSVAKENSNAVLQKIEEVQSARRHFQRLFSDLENLDDSADQLIDEKLTLLTEKREQEESMRKAGLSSSTRGRTRWLVVALMALLPALAVYWFMQDWLFAGGAGVFAGALTLLIVKKLARKKEMAQPETKLGEINARLRQIDTNMGSFAQAGEARLGELRARLQQRKTEAERLETIQRSLPSDQELHELKNILDLAKNENSAFEALTNEAAAAYENVPAAFEKWSQAVRECELLRKKTKEFAVQYGSDQNPARLMELEPALLPEPWPQLLEFAQALGKDLPQVISALQWIDTLNEAWWSDICNRAAQYECLLDECKKLKQELAAYGSKDQDGLTKAEKLAAGIESLREKLAPFDETTGVDTLEAMLEDCRVTENEKTRVLSLGASFAQRQQEVSVKVAEITNIRTPLTAKLDKLISSKGTVVEALQAWQLYTYTKNELEKDRKEMSGLLSAHNVNTTESLRAKLADVSTKSAMLLGEWEQLLSTNPGLPPRNESSAVELDKQYRNLEENVLKLEEQREKLHAQLRENEIKLARLQGDRPPNIAMLEVRNRILDEEIVRLKREISALEIAYETLSSAIEDFSAAYRIELAGKAGEYFSNLTGKPNRQIHVDEQFSISVNDDGIESTIAQLSQGARDQLYIALRLAVADLLAGNIILPFIFDDPFLNWDESRLNHIKTKLQEIASGRQILILSHRKDFSEWGKPFLC